MILCTSIHSHGGIPLRPSRKSGRTLRFEHLSDDRSVQRTSEKHPPLPTSVPKASVFHALTPFQENAQTP
jgi:hypothetical protein